MIQTEENKRYRAYFKHLDPEDKKKFKDSKCILSISVGQPYHEGKKFEATVKLINKNFKECVVLLGDTLQRHTIGIFQPDKSDKELYYISEREGDAWLERNGKILREYLKIPYEIFRWDYWLNHPKFKYFYEAMLSLYKKDYAFKTSVDKTTEEFLIRVSSRNLQVASAGIVSLSFNYLIEECASVCLWIESGSQFEIYPTERNLAIQFIYDKYINANNIKLKPLCLRFNKILYKTSILT